MNYELTNGLITALYSQFTQLSPYFITITACSVFITMQFTKWLLRTVHNKWDKLENWDDMPGEFRDWYIRSVSFIEGLGFYELFVRFEVQEKIPQFETIVIGALISAFIANYAFWKKSWIGKILPKSVGLFKFILNFFMGRMFKQKITIKDINSPK
jgi:hypothetical protein